MAEKVKEIRVLLEDGSFSEAYPIGADASNIDLNSGKNLETALEEDYVKNTDYATSSNSGVIIAGDGLLVNNAGYTKADIRNYTQYQNVADSFFVGKGTLENVITGKNLETANNKVTTISESSTDTEYPSAKSVYDYTLGSPAKTTSNGETISVNTLDNTRLNIDLKGNTSQETTTGKNLFSGLVKGIRLDPDTGLQFNGSTGATSDYIPVNIVSGNPYYLSGLVSTIRSFTCAYNSNKEFLGRTSAQTTGEKALTVGAFGSGTPVGTGDIAYVRVTQYIQGEGTIDIIDDAKIQLELGSTATSYEPYTNGASPNPSYPQNVNVVTGDNTIVVEGKNVLNPLAEIGTINVTTGENQANNNATRLQGYIDVSSGDVWTFSRKNDSTNAKCRWYDKDYNYIGYEPQIFSVLTSTLTKPANAKYLRIVVDKVDANYFTEYECQLELGSTATDYTPYVSQNYPINLGTIELCKIGNYQDYIYKNNGNWYVHKEIGKVVLDGTENWVIIERTSGYVFQTQTYNVFKDLRTLNITFSNYFKGDTGVNVWTGINLNTCGCAESGKIRIYTDIVNSAENFQTWLGAHNTEVRSVIITATDTQITDTTLIAQLDNLYNAKSYSTTNISQENDNLPFILNVTSFNDTLNGRISSNGDRIDTLIEEVEETIDIINGEVI